MPRDTEQLKAEIERLECNRVTAIESGRNSRKSAEVDIERAERAESWATTCEHEIATLREELSALAAAEKAEAKAPGGHLAERYIVARPSHCDIEVFGYFLRHAKYGYEETADALRAQVRQAFDTAARDARVAAIEACVDRIDMQSKVGMSGDYYAGIRDAKSAIRCESPSTGAQAQEVEGGDYDAAIEAAWLEVTRERERQPDPLCKSVRSALATRVIRLNKPLPTSEAQ